jgi:hypothetical protein
MPDRDPERQGIVEQRHIHDPLLTAPDPGDLAENIRKKQMFRWYWDCVVTYFLLILA